MNIFVFNLYKSVYMNYIYRGREIVRLIRKDYNGNQWVKNTTSAVELPKFVFIV